MGQIRHGSATTTHAVRAAIQRSQASLAQLSRELGINPKTVAKWRKRMSVEDTKTGPSEPRSTVLSEAEEAMIVAFRKHTLLPLDDCLYAPHIARTDLGSLNAPRVGIVRGPGFDLASPVVSGSFEAAIARLPGAASVTLPDEFSDAVQITMDLLEAHMAERFGAVDDMETLCAPFRDCIVRGSMPGRPSLANLNAMADRITEVSRAIFRECDVLITLYAPTVATRLDEGPGSGVMSIPWSLCGLPTISLPLLRGEPGLPVGLQVTGRPGDDTGLLRAAKWLVDKLA